MYDTREIFIIHSRLYDEYDTFKVIILLIANLKTLNEHNHIIVRDPNEQMSKK